MRGEHMAKQKLPQFKTAEDEANFWETHDTVDYFDELKEVKVNFIDKRAEKCRTTIYLSKEERNKIRRLALDSNVSMAEFIRQAVNDKIAALV